MRRFNPEKELNKIKNGNKNKILYGIIALLLIVTIGSTYALYQVRHSNKLNHIIVKQFYQNDLDLAVYVDGVKKVKKEEFPAKENGTNLVYTGIKCEDGKQVKASWDYNDWSLILESKLPNKCNVYFETRYKDKSGAAYPELYQGLIPVRYDSGKIYIADLASKWYDYDQHEWANAVLIDYQNETIRNKFYDENGNLKSGDEIQESDILQMYVWIPRYRYKLWNAISGETSEPQEIKIEFEDNTIGRSIGNNNGEWYTHPAFLFGNTELNGIWVGKFQSSGTINQVTILPNMVPLSKNDLNTLFETTRNIEGKNNIYNLNSLEVDTHLIKNSEWGAVVYLSSSKYGRYEKDGKEISSGARVWANNTIPYKTGCTASTVSPEPSATCANTWNVSAHSSTTDNMYGIYDMAVESWSYVMANMLTIDGKFSPGLSGFTTIPDAKYYDAYEYSTSYNTHGRGHLGDATRETFKIFGQVRGAWYDGWSNLPTDIRPFIYRAGGDNTSSSKVEIMGIFNVGYATGGAANYASFYNVITIQDGNA